MSHTQTPWKLERFDGEYWTVTGNTGQHVTDFVKPDDAKRIVACVNSHSELIAACRCAITQLRYHVTHGSPVPVNDQDVIEMLVSVVARANGEPQKLPNDEHAKVDGISAASV